MVAETVKSKQRAESDATDQAKKAEFITGVVYHTNHSSPFRFILSHVLRHPWMVFWLFFGSLSNAVLAAVVPDQFGRSFNAMTNPAGGGLHYVGLMGLLIIVSQILRGGLQLARNFAAETFAQRIERDVRDELYASLLGKSMQFHDRLPVGEIMARVTNDVREMNLLMSPGLNLLIGSEMFLLTPLVASALIHPQLAIVPFVFVLTHSMVQLHFVRAIHPVAQQVRISFGHMNAHLAETLDGVEVVKGTAQEEYESGRFNELADGVRDHFIHQGRIEARYLSNLLLNLTLVAGFLHVVILYRAGEFQGVGNIVAYTTLLALFGFPVNTSLNALSRIASGYASAKRILAIINAKVDLDRNSTGHCLTVQGAIRFEDVCFSYAGDPNDAILKHISFDIQPGQTIALVGQTGSGKSTITKLINRTYDVTCGRVLIDGYDVRDWNLETLRSQISIIEQDVFLFSRTIAENIAFGRQDATQAETEAAAEKAQAHDFIMSLPEGYHTVIGQRGATLSGGQRQRIAIARAFLTNPPILILDDSTSSIDSATEDKIQQAIWSASRGRTTLLITHRLSQIRWADHIIVLRRGEVAAQGKHEDLLQSSDAYRRIFVQYADEPLPVANRREDMTPT